MPTCGNIIQCAVLALLGLAVVMVNSAAMSLGGEPITLGSLLTSRPMTYAVLAVVALLVAGHLDIRRLRTARGLANPIPWLLVIAIGLCVAALLPGVGAVINGSRRWLLLELGALKLTFQPSELAKWAVVGALAWWAAHRSGALRHMAAGLMPALVVVGLICGLVVIEDLGTAVLIGAVAMALLIAGGARLWHVGLCIPPALGAVAVMIVTSPYRVQRLVSFLHPNADPQGSGYQLTQSLVAIVAGNRGVGNGLQKLGYLPTDTSDFLFAVICEELGLGGAALVALLYGAILWSAMLILHRCRHAFDRLMTLGILLTLSLQAVMNMMVVTGMVPTKGIALPLLSAGGTGWLMTAAALGLLVALDRVQKIEAEQEIAESAALPRAVSIAAPAVAA